MSSESKENTFEYAYQRWQAPDSHAEKLIEYLLKLHSNPSIVSYKQRVFDQLYIRNGFKVLDVGCGVGDDSLDLRRRVGSKGIVVGVDLSKTFISYAKAHFETKADEQTNKGAVEFHIGSIFDLTKVFPSFIGMFDIVIVDRVLQHLDNHAQAINECMQMLREGGRLAVSDPNWSQLYCHSGTDDQSFTILDEKMAQLARSLQRRHHAGSDLLRFIAQNPLARNIVTEPHATNFFDPTSMPLPLEELKVKVSPIISKEEIDKWFQNATMLAAKGAFVGGLCIVTVFCARAFSITPNLTIEKGIFQAHEECSEIALIVNQAYLEKEGWIFEGSRTSSQEIFKLSKEKGLNFYLLKDNGKLVGSILFKVFEETQSCGFGMLAVKPDAQKKNYAKILIQYTEQLTKAEKFNKLKIDVLNVRAKELLPFYESLAFRRAGVEQFPDLVGKYAKVNCADLELIILEKRLF